MSSTSKRLPPELLADVANKLIDTADISRFSRCSRDCYDFIIPLLFRQITIPLEQIPAIANVFRMKPHIVVYCRSLSVLDMGYQNDTMEATSRLVAQNAICEDFTIVLEMLGAEKKLRDFSFPSRSWYQWYGDPITLPTRVWHALGGLSSFLVELDLRIVDTEEYTWTAFCTSTFPKLRSFCLDLRDANDWDYAPLQKMFHGLKELECLYLSTPFHQGPVGLDMSSSHPRLCTFYLSTRNYSEIWNSFIQRHPTIERLGLRNVMNICKKVGGLPHLKSLCVDETTLLSYSGMLPPDSQRSLTHLSLEYAPDLTTSMIFEFITPIAATLRCLEFIWSLGDFRNSIPSFGKLLLLLPSLNQLAIQTLEATSYKPLMADDLMKLLPSIAECTSLVNLRLSSPDCFDLPLSLLDDMGEVSTSLRYLCWGQHSNMTMYRIESREGKTVAVMTGLGSLFPGGGEDEDFASWLGPVRRLINP